MNTSLDTVVRVESNLFHLQDDGKGFGTLFVTYKNNKKSVGELCVNDDGYYVFFLDNSLENQRGYFDEWFFTEMARIMKELNAPWDKQVHEYFEKLNGPLDE